MATTISLRTGHEIPPSEVDIEYARAGGPGGQHVNKTETKVTLRFMIADSSLPDVLKEKLIKRLGTRLTKAGELLVSVDAHRERQRNLDLAFERITALMNQALIDPKKRKKTAPSRGSKERRLKAKREAADKKRARKPVRDE